MIDTHRKFWRIECTEGMEKLSSMIISIGQITDKKLEELLKILFSKYILSDEEILSNFCNKKSLRYQELIKFNREVQDNSQDKFRVIYYGDSSSISIISTLVYEDELTEKEKEKIRSRSSLKI